MNQFDVFLIKNEMDGVFILHNQLLELHSDGKYYSDYFSIRKGSFQPQQKKSQTKTEEMTKKVYYIILTIAILKKERPLLHNSPNDNHKSMCQNSRCTVDKQQRPYFFL